MSDSPIVLAGDHTDDDPQVLDSLVQQEAEPPGPRERPQVYTEAKRAPRPLTRMLTQTAALHTTGAPVLLLPADADRESMSIRVADSTDPVYVRVSDDSGKVQSDMGSLLIYPSDSLVNVFAGHTGPVWVHAVRSDASTDDAMLRLSAVAVTK